MTDFPLWLLLGPVLFRPILTFSLDVMVNMNTSSPYHQVACAEMFRNVSSQWSLSFLLYKDKDEFALSKSVKALRADTVLVAHISTQRSHLHYNVNTDQKECFWNCSAFVHRILNFTKATRQYVFDNIRPDECDWGTVGKATNSILSKEKWRTHLIFSSTNEEFASIFSSLQSLKSNIIVFNLDSETHLNDTLNILYTMLDKKDLNFLIICSSSCIVELLHQAYILESVVRKTSRWLVIPTDGCATDVVNTSKEIPEADIVILDLSACSNNDSFLSLETLLEKVSNIDVKDLRDINVMLEDYIEQIRTRTDSLVLASVNVIHASHIDRNVRQVGYIQQTGDLTITEELFPGENYGFNRRTLTVSTLEWPPFVIKTEEGGSVRYNGICMDLLQELSRGLNFSYTIVEPEDQQWGSYLDGRWTGLIGQLADKAVDIVAAPIAMLEAREIVMDFTIPYFYVQSGIILKTPDPNANKWMILVAPFRYEVHLCILVTMLFSAVLLFTVEEVNPVNNWTKKKFTDRWKRYGDIIWYHFRAIMANGGTYVPSAQSSRIIWGCWWLFTVISAAIYSGNLISFLTDWREKPSFSSLTEMVEQDTYSWGSLGGTSYITLFQNSERPEYQKIWQGMKSDPERTSTTLAVHKRKVFAGGYAYLGDEILVEVWNSGHCDLQMIIDQYLLMNYGIGLQNNSAYTSLFSEQVLRINEIGLPRIWYERWTSSLQCETCRSAKRVDLLALQSAFYASGVGVLLGFSAIVIEIMYNRKVRKYALKSEHTLNTCLDLKTSPQQSSHVQVGL